MTLFDKLDDYYEKNGIAALNFNCKYYQNCKEGYEDRFTTSKEALIGAFYGKSEIPKLLIISLDPGYSTSNSINRTLENQRNNINDVYAKSVKDMHKNSHWWRTHEIVYAILHKYEKCKDVNQEEMTKYFAHTNSAKCCIDNDGGKKAPSKFFKNCKEFLPGEVTIIDPDIIVTQGNEAYDSIKNSFSVIESNKITQQRSCYDTYKIIEINNKNVLWIHVYHSTYYAIRRESQYQSECFQTYGEIAYKFITNKING